MNSTDIGKFLNPQEGIARPYYKPTSSKIATGFPIAAEFHLSAMYTAHHTRFLVSISLFGNIHLSEDRFNPKSCAYDCGLLAICENIPC